MIALPDSVLDKNLATENHDTSFIAFACVFQSFSLITVILRLVSSRMKRLEFHVDDYLVIASWCISLGQSLMLLSGIRSEVLGRHTATLSAPQMKVLLKGYYAFPLIHNTALALAKLSVLAQLYRIFPISKLRLTIIILKGIVLTWLVSGNLAYAFICIPVQSKWEPNVPHRCGNQHALNLALPIPWILTDIAILIAPIPDIKRLQVSISRKVVGLCALVLTGGPTSVVAFCKWMTLFAIDLTDFAWSLTECALWSIIETNVSVVCACTSFPIAVLFLIHPTLSYQDPEQGGREENRRNGHSQNALRLAPRDPHKLSTDEINAYGFSHTSANQSFLTD